MFRRLVMKLPAKPTIPYMRHSAHTLREPRNRATGAGEARPTSAGFASGGRSRNHGQNRAHHTSPSPASSHRGVDQLPKAPVISHTTSTGATAPPTRLDVQTSP